MTNNPLQRHRAVTLDLARKLQKQDLYGWLMQSGYFPESYVLPPCFTGAKRPAASKPFTQVTKEGAFNVRRSACLTMHFQKTDLTDRTFSFMHPEIYNDIAYLISENWIAVAKAMIPADSRVASYSFSVPVDARNAGCLGQLGTGRMIYEFISMVDDDLIAIADRYTHLTKADIKGFYSSIYTPSIAWALHGKGFIRKPANQSNFNLFGNRLVQLFQSANDGSTSGIPIGPVVSDIAAEIVASGVDRILSKYVAADRIDCEIVRFKDDYRILTNSEADSRRVVKHLQAALKEYNLELSEAKTSISMLPDGLFREWVSKYYAAHPTKRESYSWKEFRELYLATLRINSECPDTGVIDRFLADIMSRDGNLKISVDASNLQKMLSMMLMLGRRRIKSFPNVIAIIETVLRSPFGLLHQAEIAAHLGSYLESLSANETRNRYPITWIGYFLVSNRLQKHLTFKPKFKDPIVRSVFSGRNAIFSDCADFKLFDTPLSIGKRVSMVAHLDVFNPPQLT